MDINKDIAQKIVNRAMKIIPYSINVMNKDGIIIASGDTSRLNQRHTGAILSIRENRIVEITSELAKQWNYEAREGINLPITYQGKVLGVVGISGMPSEVKPFAELVKMTAELIIEQAILLEQERWEHRYKEEFVLNLLNDNRSFSELKQQARFFNINLDLPYIVAVIKICQSNSAKLQELVTYLNQSDSSHHIAILSLNTVAILLLEHEINQKKLNQLLPPNTSLRDYKIAVGAKLENKFSLHLSYKTALSTLKYGQHFFPKRSIYFFEQHQLPVLLDNLADSWQAEELLKPMQGLYEQDQNAQLRKTLQQYFLSNCDLTRTSKNLFIHINTLRYRLKKIELLTHLQFNNINDLFILYLGTILDKSLSKSTIKTE